MSAFFALAFLLVSWDTIITGGRLFLEKGFYSLYVIIFGSVFCDVGIVLRWTGEYVGQAVRLRGEISSIGSSSYFFNAYFVIFFNAYFVVKLYVSFDFIYTLFDDKISHTRNERTIAV